MFEKMSDHDDHIDRDVYDDSEDQEEWGEA